jgi:hypothetical protein
MSLNFEVVIQSSDTRTQEWQRAQHAPLSELRIEELTAGERSVAERHGLPIERVARTSLAVRYGRERHKSEGQALGQHIVEFLRELGPTYSLKSVIGDAHRDRWMLRVETPKGLVGIPVPFDLADDVVDSNVLAAVENLRRLVFEGVGQGGRSTER